MFAGYIIALSTLIQVSNMAKASTTMVYAGLGFAGILILGMIAFIVIMHNKPEIFGEFT